MLTIGGHVKWGPHLVILSLEEAEVFCQEEVDDGLWPLIKWPRGRVEDGVSSTLSDRGQVDNLANSLQLANNEADGLSTPSFSSLLDITNQLKID